MNFKILKIIIIFLTFSIFSHVLSKNQNLQTKKICILNQKKEQRSIIVELANTVKSRTYGLMYRKKVDLNKGMLFIFKKEKYLSFWMKNVSIPLSIAYIDKNGIIKDIQDMKPFDISITYPSKYPAKYALEVNQGWFKKNMIKEGNKVLLNGCLGK